MKNCVRNFVSNRLYLTQFIVFFMKAQLLRFKILTHHPQKPLFLHKSIPKSLNFFSFSSFFCSAKNQGIAITKNTASTTLHTDHHSPYTSSHSPQSSTHVSVESTSINGFPTSRSELDIAMLQILDSHLRPIPPANDPTSQKIYKEHMELAQEYFKVSYY